MSVIPANTSTILQEVLPQRPERLVVGTGNKGKINEVKKGLRTLGVEQVLSGRDMEPPDAPEIETNFERQAEAKARFYADALGPDMQDKSTWYVSDDSGISVAFNHNLSDPSVLAKLKENGIDLQNYKLPNGKTVDFSNFPLTDDVNENLLAAEDFPGLATGRVARLFAEDGLPENHEAACTLYKRIHRVLNGTEEPVLVNFVSAISIASADKTIGTYRADQPGLLLSPGKPGPNGFGYDANFAPLTDNPGFRSYAQMTAEEKAKTSPRAEALRKASADLQKHKFIIDHHGAEISIDDNGLRHYFHGRVKVPGVTRVEETRALAGLFGNTVMIKDRKVEFALTPDNVNLVAKLSTQAASRKLVMRDAEFQPKWGIKPVRMVPLIAANVHFMGLRMAHALTHLEVPSLFDPNSRIQCAIKKEVSQNDMVNFLANNGTASAWMTLGISGKDEVTNLAQTFNRVREKLLRNEMTMQDKGIRQVKVVIDASNGHMQLLLDRVKAVREFLTNFENLTGVPGLIMAGNIVTGEMVREALEAGADTVKIGHGNSDVCRTEENTGFHRAMFTAMLECFRAAQECGGYAVPDGGGNSNSSTAAKLFAAGARMIMSGSLFAGQPQNDTKIHKDPKTGLLYILYHGSASHLAEDRAKGNHSEGTVRKVFMHDDPLAGISHQWLGSVASAVSFNADEIQHVHPETGQPYWDFHDLARNPHFSYSM